MIAIERCKEADILVVYGKEAHAVWVKRLSKSGLPMKNANRYAFVQKKAVFRSASINYPSPTGDLFNEACNSEVDARSRAEFLCLQNDILVVFSISQKKLFVKKLSLSGEVVKNPDFICFTGDEV